MMSNKRDFSNIIFIFKNKENTYRGSAKMTKNTTKKLSILNTQASFSIKNLKKDSCRF